MEYFSGGIIQKAKLFINVKKSKYDASDTKFINTPCSLYYKNSFDLFKKIQVYFIMVEVIRSIKQGQMIWNILNIDRPL